MIVQPDFLDHWKTTMLCDLLDDDRAPIYVLRLWSHCQNRKTDKIPNENKGALKAICRSPQDADLFYNAMLISGFVKVVDNELIVHGWSDINSSLIKSWENGRMGGRPTTQKPSNNPRVSHGIPMGYPRDTHGIPTGNPDETDKIRLDKIRLETHAQFEKWWDAYGKKKGRAKAEQKWNRLTDEERELCLKSVDAYVLSTPKIQYRKDPATYLNGKCWNDEILSEEQKQYTHKCVRCGNGQDWRREFAICRKCGGGLVKND